MWVLAKAKIKYRLNPLLCSTQKYYADNKQFMTVFVLVHPSLAGHRSRIALGSRKLEPSAVWQDGKV